MANVNLAEFDGDQIVIHFGGTFTSIDAYTFANSLVAFADTVRATNNVLSSNKDIDVRVEAIGHGSFRAVIKRITRDVGNLLSEGAKSIFWAIIAALIYDKLIRSEPTAKIIINATEVVFEIGDDRIIVPREVYKQMENARSDSEVQRNLSRTFNAVEVDEHIQNFGITPRIDDPEPVIQIPRSIFPQLSSPSPMLESDPRRRDRLERVRLVIFKAWLTPGKRKWSFEWNGFPLSAPILDEVFWSKLADGSILIGQGDALDVDLRFQQFYDEAIGTWINDQHTFEVAHVITHLPRSPRAPRLI